MENKVNSNIRRKRLTAIVGHYGSGKTEFAVNMALQTAKAKEGKEDTLYLVDLDIVNPYFRSREREFLAKMKENLKIRWFTDIVDNNEYKEYIKFIEDYLGVPIKYISVGPDRKQTITRVIR